MRRVLFVLSAMWCMAVSANVVNYTADDQSIFPNPERGFTEELSRKVTASKPNVVKGHLDANWGGNLQMTLAVVLYNFNYFKAQDLPEEVLTGFDEDMQVLRTNGVKCVLRFAYTESESDKVDATPAWVKRHLEQLKPHLAANADVIYVLEAGFVGVWGEWYYTTNYGNESQHMNAKRRQVIQYLFENAPTNRFILFRYPMLKTEYLGHTTPLPADSAFSGSMRARWGCHNDAFLNDWGNDGTYASNNKSDDPAVRQYIADETLYVPNGGETNVEDNTLAQKVYNKAESEMSTYHWSFCGSTYAEEVTSRWRTSGIIDNLNRKMGYRYQLVQATLPEAASAGGTMAVRIRMKNVGYAPLYNERKAYIVLSNQNSVFSIQISSDPRRWLPNGAETVIDEQLTIPAEVPEGTYDLYLYMPDMASSIAADPRYAIRFANVGTWDGTTGMNSLLASITIQASGPEGMESVVDAGSCSVQKVLRDGCMLIVRGEKSYTVTGQKIQ